MTTIEPIQMYLVGGAVRDYFMGTTSPPKDLDFAVEATDYAHMRSWLTTNGAKLYLERPQFVSIRCSVPTTALNSTFGGILPPPVEGECVNADFTLCRRDGFYSDGRHPDNVLPGTIIDDLARRDFTMNAMALCADGTHLDPHMGMYAMRYGQIETVGAAADRIREDPLRILRAMRFAVTKNMVITHDLQYAIDAFAPLLTTVSTERVAEELLRMFKYTPQALALLVKHPAVMHALFTPTSRLWLQPTLKDR